MPKPIDDVRHLREPRGIALLWFAVLAGPLAWMLGLNAQYGLVRVACAKQNMLYLHSVTLATLLLAVAGGLVAWREWKRTGRECPGEEAGAIGRSRFMVMVGLLGSALFTLAILSQWAANLFFHPCMAI
jgi:nicotinamide riboside transporter PnuC